MLVDVDMHAPLQGKGSDGSRVGVRPFAVLSEEHVVQLPAQAPGDGQVVRVRGVALDVWGQNEALVPQELLVGEEQGVCAGPSGAWPGALAPQQTPG